MLAINRALRPLITALIAMLLVVSLAWPVGAQIITDPPPLPPPPPPPSFPQVTVERHQVDATITGPVASVRVTQIFRNDSGRVAEGVYLFPLPKDAAVSDFQLTVDGQTLEGRLLSREEARRIYEEIVRSQRDPALLEYIDRGLFEASVFPIPPGETRKVEFTYTQALERQEGLFRFNYPLPTRRYSTAPVEMLGVTVRLEEQIGLRTLYSPNYPIRIERAGDDDAVVYFEAEDSQPQNDFDLFFGTDDGAIGVNLVSYRPAGEEGYFVLLAAPGIEVEESEVVARDVILVIDVSGSMQGEKIEQARGAARFVVEHLNPDDRFNLLTFSTGTRRWQRTLQPVTADNMRSASRWIDSIEATGSTDINRALLEALAQTTNGDGKDAGRPAYILFLTDGQPTQGELDPARIVDNARNNKPDDGNVRLFTFGIGYDVNTDLLDIVSQELGGRDSYVTPDEPVDEAVGEFYRQISTPVLANVEVAVRGTGGDEISIDDVYPYPLPDLFAGEQLVVTGRYGDGGVVKVELSGNVNGEERLYVYPELALASEGGEPFVARLWATRKIGALLEQVRRSGPNDEVIEAIVDLSLRYGIVTPYTSYLVEEPGLQAPAGGEVRSAPAPRALDAAAQRNVQAATESLAAEAAAGAAAVKASIARSALQEATRVTEESAIRFVEGRTFKLQEIVTGPDGLPREFWVDTKYEESMDVTLVEFGSDAYFALLGQPGMAAWLSLSPEMVVVTGAEEAIRVTTLEEGE